MIFKRNLIEQESISTVGVNANNKTTLSVPKATNLTKIGRPSSAFNFEDEHQMHDVSQDMSKEDVTVVQKLQHLIGKRNSAQASYISKHHSQSRSRSSDNFSDRPRHNQSREMVRDVSRSNLQSDKEYLLYRTNRSPSAKSARSNKSKKSSKSVRSGGRSKSRHGQIKIGSKLLKQRVNSHSNMKTLNLNKTQQTSSIINLNLPQFIKSKPEGSKTSLKPPADWSTVLAGKFIFQDHFEGIS